LQPGQLDGGTLPDAVAALTRDAMALNIDAAVATLNGSRQLLNDQLSIGRLSGVAQPQLEMQVCKSGRTSNVTFGLVTGTNGVTSPIQYDSITRIIKSVVTIDPRSTFEQVSAAGDSGSCWLDPENNRAVALHFAGSDFPQRALAMDMQTVLDALEVDLAAAPEAVTAAGLADRSQAGIPLPRVRTAAREGRPEFNSGSWEAAHLKKEAVWR
jgi:endonuclease G